jgi:GntR family transcriptional regulator
MMFSDKLPITYQLAQVIRADIMRGAYPPGSRLPTELQLASDYDVSVITVQRALKTLEAESLIKRYRARGTFVEQIPAHLISPNSPTALETMLSDEFTNETKILEKKIVPTPPQFQQRFKGAERLMIIKRLVILEGQPWSYTTHYVLPELGRKMTTAQLKRYPMFRILREFVGLPLKHVESSLEAVTAPLEISRLLEIDPLAPTLLFTGALYSTNGLLVDMPEIYYRGDRFKFRFDMDLTS